MDLSPGEITQQALAKQIRINAAIEKDLIDIATRKACACSFNAHMPDVYKSSMNK
jgi:hypothetical protein